MDERQTVWPHSWTSEWKTQRSRGRRRRRRRMRLFVCKEFVVFSRWRRQTGRQTGRARRRIKAEVEEEMCKQKLLHTNHKIQSCAGSRGHTGVTVLYGRV